MRAAVKFGFPADSGVVEDRDWMEPDYADFLTHYSVHDNATNKAFMADVNMGIAFNILNKFQIKPYLGYSFMTFSWTASGGSFLYPGVHGDHSFLLTPMDVGTYTQSWNIISTGVSFYGAFNDYFDIEIGFAISPFIWCKTEDHHISRELIIKGTLNGGFYFDPGLVFSFKQKNLLTLSLSVSYRFIADTRGDGEYNYPGQVFTAKNMAGAGYRAMNFGIFGKYSIF